MTLDAILHPRLRLYAPLRPYALYAFYAYALDTYTVHPQSSSAGIISQLL